jgi:hypothetical protein
MHAWYVITIPSHSNFSVYKSNAVHANFIAKKSENFDQNSSI